MPADPGTFDIWLSQRIDFGVAGPATGNIGEFDRWITQRVFYDRESAGAFVPPVFPWVYPLHAVYDASEQHAAYDDSFQHADYDPSEQHAEYSYE